MKRSKSVDLYQEPSLFTHKSESNKTHRQLESINHEFTIDKDHSSSLSSSSSSSMADIERVNRAALLRYKSLDSMTVNNRKLNLTRRNYNRKFMSKPLGFDFDSDDSICGIPKPQR